MSHGHLLLGTQKVGTVQVEAKSVQPAVDAHYSFMRGRAMSTAFLMVTRAMTNSGFGKVSPPLDCRLIKPHQHWTGSI